MAFRYMICCALFLGLLLESSCKKEKQSRNYTLTTADTSIAVTGTITIEETINRYQLRATVHAQGLWLYEGLLLNTHIHQGSYPASVGAVRFDFGKQKVINGEINAVHFIDLSFDAFTSFDGVFVLHKPDNVSYLATVEIGNQ